MGVEPVMVEFVEVRGVENGHVDMAVAEQVLFHALFPIVAEFLERPDRVRRAHATVILVEALYPAFAVLVPPVPGPCIPQMRMAIDHEDTFSIVPVHRVSPLASYCWRPEFMLFREARAARQIEALASMATRTVRIR